MKLLTQDQQESCEDAKKSVILVKKKLKRNLWKIKNMIKLEIIAIIGLIIINILS